MSREAAFSALFAAVSAAYPWGLASRRMKLWSEVPVGAAPGVLPARERARDLSVALARDAEAHVRSQALPLFRLPRSDDARRDRRSTPRSTRSTPRSRPPGPTPRSAARRSAAPCTTARLRPCRCAIRATSTATGWRWSACGWLGRDALSARRTANPDAWRADPHHSQRRSPMFVFGSGVLIGTPAGGSPINFGLAQEVTLNIADHHQGALRAVQLSRRDRLRHQEDDRQGQDGAHLGPGAGLAVFRR